MQPFRRGDADPNDDGYAFDEFDHMPMVTYASLGLSEAAQLSATALEAGPGGGDDDGEKEDDDPYEPLPLKTRRHERKVLGKPGDRSNCFLCSHKGERSAVPVKRSDVDKMIEYMRSSIGQMKSALLAVKVADKYAVIRARVNANIKPGETPLPYMSAATVLDHIRRHIQDPEVKQIVMLEELQEAREEGMDMMFERTRRTKRKRFNKTNVDCLEKIVKLELLVQSKDPSKMAMYSAGARVSQAARQSGPVSTGNKRLYEFFKRAKTGVMVDD